MSLSWPLWVMAALFVFAALLWWLARLAPDLSWPGEQLSNWEKEPFDQTGRLPMSRQFSGTFYRWHNPEKFWMGDEFWRTFEDGPWKWEAQQRYAGKNVNCGHYFSVSVEGAEAEARFYHMD